MKEGAGPPSPSTFLRALRSAARAELGIALCGFVTAFVTVPGGAETSLEFSASVMNESGYLGLRSDLPDAAARDWYSLSSAVGRLSLVDGDSVFYGKLWASLDAATAEWRLSLDEAWYQWRGRLGSGTEGTVTEVGLRLGRSPLSFRPCLAFSPANPYSPKDAFDPRASQLGLDGIFLSLMLPLSPEKRSSLPSVELRTAILLPSQGFRSLVDFPAVEGASDLGDASVHGRLSLFFPGDSHLGRHRRLGSHLRPDLLGPVELGLSCDLHRIAFTVDGGGAWDAGAWCASELAGFVFGAEGSIRSAGYGYAFGVNRRMGDFFALAEAGYEEADGMWRAFGRLSWAPEDYELSLSALVDFESLAARTSLSAARNLGEAFLIRGSLGWNHLPEKWKQALPVDWAAGLNLECFF